MMLSKASWFVLLPALRSRLVALCDFLSPVQCLRLVCACVDYTVYQAGHNCSHHRIYLSTVPAVMAYLIYDIAFLGWLLIMLFMGKPCMIGYTNSQNHSGNASAELMFHTGTERFAACLFLSSYRDRTTGVIYTRRPNGVVSKDKKRARLVWAAMLVGMLACE